MDFGNQCLTKNDENDENNSILIRKHPSKYQVVFNGNINDF